LELRSDHLDRWLAVVKRWDEAPADEAFPATNTGDATKLPK
jgi:hypothetical protein